MDGFIGEIRAFGFNYYPQGWLPCNGNNVSLQEYQVLFAVIGTNYGPSDSRTYFTLPNLQGISLLGATNTGGYVPVGTTGGAENVTLSLAQLTQHNHTMMADKRSGAEASLGTNIPSPTVFLSNPLAQTSSGGKPGVYAYSDVHPSTEQPNQSLAGISGQSMPHDNMMPYLAMQYCICYDGTFPTHND